MATRGSQIISKGLWQSLRRPWICPHCARNGQQVSRRAERALKSRSFSASTSTAQQYAAPSMMNVNAAHTQRNLTTLYYSLSLIISTVALSYGSVPMYKMICQQTGWGGQPIKSAVHGSPNPTADPAERVTPVEGAPRLRITFAGSTSDILPWKFVPQQREVRIRPGETALAFYTATNKSKADIIGVATYSVTPGGVAPYFSKIQCFCFEEQRLNAGETVDMPVFFYIDPDFLNDPEMRNINTVTLNYTFFKAKYDDNGVLEAVPGS